MKKSQIFLFTAIFIFSACAVFGQKKDSLEKNKEIAARYHELRANDVDNILTKDFLGRNEKSRMKWNLENHRSYLSNGTFKKDSILQQVAEGDWVATRFVRTMDWQGQRVKIEAMQFKRFENGKIAEIYEYGDQKQIETTAK